MFGIELASLVYKITHKNAQQSRKRFFCKISARKTRRQRSLRVKKKVFFVQVCFNI